MSPFVAPLFGLALVVLGAAFLRRHRRTWRERKNDPSLEHGERPYYLGQYRRRMVTSGLLIALGILIPIGDLLFDRRFQVATVTIYWIAVLSLVLVVLLLGVVDFFATGMHTKDALMRVRSEKAALQRQIEEVRRSLREGGEVAPPDSPPYRNGRLENHERHGTPGGR